MDDTPTNTGRSRYRSFTMLSSVCCFHESAMAVL